MQARKPSRRPDPRIVSSLVAAVLAVGLNGALAAADDPAVPSADEVETQVQSDPNVPNTDYTPKYGDDKLSTEWRQVEGAQFRFGDDPAKAEGTIGAVTTYDDNLHAVAFRNESIGLAGGARCADSNPDAEKDCRPVMFQYRKTPEGSAWSKVELPGEQGPGYVGAIAWIDARRAMVVGGTGYYPRREERYRPECQSDDPLEPWGVKCDVDVSDGRGAGMARIWLFDRGGNGEPERWCELGQDPSCSALPSGMRGLTAVDFKPGGDPEVGFVGGLGQLHRWSGSAQSFDRRYDNHSPSEDLLQPKDPSGAELRLFRFRVRAIRVPEAPTARAYAVTSGCCTAQDSSDQPTLLTYQLRGPTGQQSERWGIYESDLAPLDRSVDGTSGLPASTSSGAHQSGPERIDSVYGILAQVATNQFSSSYGALLLNTASDDSLVEPRSQIRRCVSLGQGENGTSPSDAQSEPRDAIVPLRGAARLLAMDGGTPSDLCAGVLAVGPDWSVGELRTSAVTGRGRQGLVLSAETRERRRETPVRPLPGASPPVSYSSKPNVLVAGLPELGAPLPPIFPQLVFQDICSTSTTPPSCWTPDAAAATAAAPGYQPTDPEHAGQTLAARDRLVSSYTLNGLDMVLSTGTGWAVGDHGSILSLSGGDAGGPGTGRAEPQPPAVGESTLRPFESSEPFDALRPRPATGGAVPALAIQPIQRLDEPRLVPMGSPDIAPQTGGSERTEDVARIVMSRDGFEGWAVGPSPHFGPGATIYGQLSLYHFDGVTWSRCDPLGIPGQIAADPACAGIAPLQRYFAAGNPHSVRLVSAARVPTERDADLAHHDDFSVVAIGHRYLDGRDSKQQGVVLRMDDGVWGIDESFRDAVRKTSATILGSSGIELRDIAFTAPDDGWVLGTSASTACGGEYVLFHYDGTSWSSQRTGPSGCADARILFSDRQGKILGLVSAGDRVYLYGWRNASSTVSGLPGESSTGIGVTRPMILFHERGRPFLDWTDGGQNGGGYDPGWADPSKDEQGKVLSLSVVQRPDGSYRGWAMGRFFPYAAPPDQAKTGSDMGDDAAMEGGLPTAPPAVLMRLKDDGAWQTFQDPGALSDLMSPMNIPDNFSPARASTRQQLQLSMIGATGEEQAFIAQRRTPHLFRFDAARGRFDLVDAQRPLEDLYGSPSGAYQALAPDGQGGFWAAVKSSSSGNESLWSQGGPVFFFHYTDRPRRPVFDEVSHPLAAGSERFTALAGAADGTTWASTDDGQLARYDRMTGWQVVSIPGWDPGRLVTRRSKILAIGLNPDGVGIAVGKGGRIADLGPRGVQLDAASGRRCAGTSEPGPCGTGYDLQAAAVAADGSALAAGDALTVLWRPPGGEFRRVAGPKGNAGNRIVGASMPAGDRAYLVSDAGYVYRGDQSGGGWVWTRENVDENSDAVGQEGEALRAIAVDAGGHGYAVGDKGVLLRRNGDSDTPWRRVRGPGTDDLLSIARADDGSAVIGGRNGVIWTGRDDLFAIARPADYIYGYTDHLGAGSTTGPVVGVAIAPGSRDGQVEAWAAIQARGDGTDRLLHYTSDPGDLLLSPDARVAPLPDAPAPQEGELRIAALGNMGCETRSICPVFGATLARREVIARRVVEQLRGEARAGRGASLAVFTGDTNSSAGLPAASVHKSDRVGAVPNVNYATGDPTTNPYGQSVGAWAPIAQRQWGRLIADRLQAGGVPLYGTPGGGDLSRPLYKCDFTGCGGVGEEAKTGDNLTWRSAMEARQAPWGKQSGEVRSAGGLSLEPVPGADAGATQSPELQSDPDGDGPVPAVEFKAGARTHYAVDIKRDGAVAGRLVAIDSSLRSLSAGEAVQQPLESNGQLDWLERMICYSDQRTARGDACSRKRGTSVVVLTNTPTYTYGSGLTETNTVDGIQFESLLMRFNATAVITGRLNGAFRYWATAPGIHEPCPGFAYQDAPPAPERRVCGRAETDEATSVANRATVTGGAAVESVAEVLRGLGAPPPPTASTADTAAAGVTGILPFVVAATAGGPLATNDLDATTASDGYWNGYSVVRVPADADPAGVIVEQRPIFDWISLTGPAHVVRPGQRIALHGVGREPIGQERGRQVGFTRFDEIDSPAITHRYDLIEADPGRPWQPKVDPGNGNPHGYVQLDPSVARIDATGMITATRGSRPRTYALAVLSVGDRAASWPLVFESRRSFAASGSPAIVAPAPPSVRVMSFNPAAIAGPPAAPPASPPPPLGLSLQLPTPPAVPGLPTEASPTVVAPVPPAPPAPPGAQSAVGLDPSVSPAGLTVPPTTGVTAQPTPPVNPSPPGGARKEARQKQAATAKAEEGSSQEASEAKGLGGDMATRPSGAEGAAFGRRDRIKAAADGFTPLARANAQPSGWATGLYWGGGIGLMALTLALGFATLRPRPRRRPPVVPAAAWTRRRQ